MKYKEPLNEQKTTEVLMKSNDDKEKNNDGIIKETGINGFLLLLFGGIAYTIGAILYGLGKKKSVWFHTVFHCFVIVGMILQFVSVYLYVL